MLDINLFREDKGHNPEIIRESQRRRFADVDLVDQVIQLDREWRQRKSSLSSSIYMSCARFFSVKYACLILLIKICDENRIDRETVVVFRLLLVRGTLLCKYGFSTALLISIPMLPISKNNVLMKFLSIKD